MQLTDYDAYVAAGNVCVPLTVFERVWIAAERRNKEQGAPGQLDWHAGGVCAVCRWLARAAIDDGRGRRALALAPATSRAVLAYEETIEAEYLASQTLAARRPFLVEHQPGWCEAIAATLAWAWRGQGDPPLPIETPPAQS